MSSRILHTPSAADGTVRRRRIRNLLVAILVPVLLAAAYLAGMSGADARDQSLPALIVNEDEMYETTTETGETTTVIAGRLLVTALTDPENAYGFSWGLANAATAEAALAAGDAYVVVTIPSDFSESVASLGTNQPTPAQIQVTTDQSHDYLGGQAAGALTNALTAAFGTEITKMIAVGLAQGFSETGSALQEAADGARQLAGGADQLGTGFDEYTAGQAQITDGLSQSATGASQLSDGVGQYTDGASQLATGVTSYTDGVQTYVDGVNAYSSGVDEFAGGVAQAGQVVGQISQEDLDAISQSGPALLEAADAFDAAGATYAESIRPVLENAESAKAVLVEACNLQPDPADQQTCIENAEALAGGAGGAMTVLDGIFAQDIGGQLRQLAPMVAELPAMVGGVQQLVSAAGQIQAAGVQIRDGGGQLTAGGGELATGASALSTGGDALATGASDLASGLALLSDGQAQLAAGNPQIRDGMTQLSGGATSLADGLQDGATQARDALGDPETYGDALANPVEATLVAQHSPGFGGMLLAIVLPIVVWLAALVTSLARRIVTREALASTGSNARLLVRALARVALPVAAVAVVVSIVGHIWAGVPFWSILGTIGIGLLAALAIGGLHVLFSALWGRRFGAIASVAFLALQLLAVRGFLPMEFRAPWLDALATISPLAHATAGLQLIYAGGGAGGVVQAVLSIVLIGLIAVGAAGLVIGRKRSTSLGRVVDLRAFGERAAAAG